MVIVGLGAVHIGITKTLGKKVRSGSREVAKKAGELGLLMIDIPEEYGGLELDLLTSMLCAEVMSSYASWNVTFGAHTGIGTLPLLYFGNEEQRKRYLPKLATGEMLAAYALTEPTSGSDALNVRTKAVLVTGDDGKEYWKLNGTKMWITNGGFADLVTVFAKVDGQAFSAFLQLLQRVDDEFLSEERRVNTPAEIAEGEHMLLHLVKAAIDIWVDNDASRPRFAPLASPVLKWGGEGADNPAHCAPLDPARRSSGSDA